MTTPKPPHTPGPWVLEDPWTVVSSIVEDDGSPRFIVNTDAECKDGETRGNAALIAAAPDLLAACEYALALAMMVGDGVNPHSYRAVQCYGTLRAAIARARGETP